jgi:phosphoglycerol geranylgeranyltransferase
MISGGVEAKLLQTAESRGAVFTVLMDPDSHTVESFRTSAEMAAKNGADCFFVGGSFMGTPQWNQMVADLKSLGLPVVLFPGGAAQVAPGADAILFTTLVSGRNAQYLIDEQIRGAVLVRAHRIEPIPCAYLLIESGKVTAVEYISNTKPIPADKPKITAATVLASQMMGMRWAYLEAGSGAKNPVPVEHVALCKMATEAHLIVGGGITRPELAAERVQAGAKMIVTGNLWEKVKDEALLAEFAAAVHAKG